MTLQQVVKGYLAAERMAPQTVEYDLALALLHLKEAAQREVAFYVEQERALVEQYAAVDDEGRTRWQGNRFVLRDPTQWEEYVAKRGELDQTQSQISWQPVTVRPPREISGENLEGLSPFLRFEQEGMG